MTPITVERLSADAGGLKALAALRMRVFRAWPYLYDGDEAYEERYLNDFFGSALATLVLARIGDRPVGMATASPLAGQPESLTVPLSKAGIAIADAFYFGESVLLPECRGQGIGHRFFDEREAAAREAGATCALFCGVVRANDDPRRPADARDLAPFWRGRGYIPIDGARCVMEWKESDSQDEIAHPMQFWMKPL